MNLITTNIVRKLWVLLLFSYTAVIAQPKQAKPPRPKLQWKTLSKSDYSIKYPASWEVNEKGERGTSFFILSPTESAKDKFRENVNLILQDLSGTNITLDQYVETSEEQIKTMLTEPRIIENKRINMPGKPEYHKMIFTGRQGALFLKFEQYYMIKNGIAYALTLATENKAFDHYKTTGEKILNSFLLK